MDSNRHFFIYLLVAVVLLLSGCIGDTYSTGSPSTSFSGYGNGIKIQSFGFSSDKVYSGIPSVLSVEMQNLGAKDAENIYVYLYGLSRGENEWFADDEDGVVDIGYSGAEMASGDPRILIIDSLMSPVKSINANGESAYISWMLTAPCDLPEKQVFKYSAGVRICYSYETTSIAKINVLDKEEYISRNRDGGLKRYPIVLSTTAGPIEVVMTTEQPMILSEEVDNLIFRAKLVDRGGGTITMNDCTGAVDWENNVLDLFTLHDKVTVTLGGRECDLGLRELYFKISDSAPPTADFPVTCSVPSFDDPELHLNLAIHLEYNYFIDKNAVISVEGLGEEEFE
ncbi:MAG: hypothetical protein GQ477_00485 [Nanohaloarchaea archaeon]|nr:hypothetical protein [Candidatus Nanohaloarchaea archaeon]